MTTLLHLDASPSFDTSISRRLSNAYLQQRRHDSTAITRIIRRDLARLDIPVVDQAWIGAAFTPRPDRTEAQNARLALSDSLIAELKEADEYVIGLPMFNFGVPASFKLWVDQVVRLGATYGYEGGKRQGLLQGKRAQVFVASGGVYDADSGNAALNFAGPYVRAILEYMGVRDVTVHEAGNAGSIVRGEQSRDAFLAPHLAAIEQSPVR